jgi:hypothetical protein
LSEADGDTFFLCADTAGACVFPTPTDDQPVMSRSCTSPLLVNRCRVPQRTLWFGRAALYPDRVCVRGWTWQGRYRRVIPLERIDAVKWWAVMDDVNFLLHLDSGRAVPLQLLKGAGTWNAELHNLIGESMLKHHCPPDTAAPVPPPGGDGPGS